MNAPSVCYVLPVLNEERRVVVAARAALDQDYPGSQTLVIAVAPSEDDTERVAAELAAADPRVRVVANPRRDIPAGLNAAIAAGESDVVIRVDAHTVLPAGYTARMVEVLRETGAANVGGVMSARGETPVQRSVARVYNSPLGLGGGVYHSGQVAGPAESAYLGVFWRWVLAEVGGYDENLRRGEDYELNRRIIGAGHLVWFDPTVRVTYYPRSTWPALARQMYATGAWRGHLVRRDRSTGLRYLVPPALVLSVVASVLVLLGRLAGVAPSWTGLVYLGPASYLSVLGYALGGGLGARSLGDRVRDACTLLTTHLSWGTGFLVGLGRGAGGVVDTSRVQSR